jgi:hypothetical protein
VKGQLGADREMEVVKRTVKWIKTVLSNIALLEGLDKTFVGEDNGLKGVSKEVSTSRGKYKERILETQRNWA